MFFEARPHVFISSTHPLEENIIARPLEVDEIMEIGVTTQKQMPLTAYARRYIESLKIYVTEYNK